MIKVNVEHDGGLVKRGGSIHLVGAGGSGVGSLMTLLSDLGYSVSACDQAAGPWLDVAKRRGIDSQVASGAGRVPQDCRYLVHSAAMPSQHPDLLTARASGIRVVKYSEFVGLLMDERDGVCIAGTHGKTTTAAWTSYLLQLGGLEPSSLIGGVAQHLPTGARAGNGSAFVVEACEYDNSFLNLRPLHAAITNVEPDHLDYFKTESRMNDSFVRFLRGVRPGGAIVLGDAIPAEIDACIDPSHHVIRIGDDGHAPGEGALLVVDSKVVGGRYQFRLDIEGVVTPLIQLRVPGRHNVKNAMIAAGLARVHGMDAETIAEGLSTFRGVGRRLEVIHDDERLTMFEDYAHHPTEIEVAIDSLREMYPSRRLVVLFQPHQVSRTTLFFDRFARALSRFDLALIADIFAVREDPDLRGAMSSDDLVRGTREFDGVAHAVGSGERAVTLASERLIDGDVCVVMGAGDINRLTPQLLASRLDSSATERSFHDSPRA